MSISAVIYARSSPDCPLSADEQLASLRTIAADNGWLVAKVFIDRPTTTKKGRDRRPGQMALLEAIRSGTVDRVMLYSIDRLGRSLADLVGFMEMCRASSVGLYLHEQRLDTATSNGLSLFDLAEMMALHLRQSRRERILRGQAAARAASVGLVALQSPPPRSREQSRDWLLAKASVRWRGWPGYRQLRAAGLSPHWHLAPPS